MVYVVENEIEFMHGRPVNGRNSKPLLFTIAYKTCIRRCVITFNLLENLFNLFLFQGMRLRQLIDEQYTASSLLGLSQSPRVTSEPTGPHLLPSSSICNNYYEKVLAENSWIKDANGVPYVQIQAAAKRVRRSGKLNPQEREKIR